MTNTDNIVDPPQSDTTVEYVAPSVHAVKQLASHIGHKFAESGEQSFAQFEIVDGLADFVSLVGTIYTKWLNYKSSDLETSAAAD